MTTAAGFNDDHGKKKAGRKQQFLDHRVPCDHSKTREPSQTKTSRTMRDAERWARQIRNEVDQEMFKARAESDRTTSTPLMDRYAREALPTQNGGHREFSE